MTMVGNLDAKLGSLNCHKITVGDIIKIIINITIVLTCLTLRPLVTNFIFS